MSINLFLMFLIGVLASYRLTVLVVFDTWPFGIMQRIRDYFSGQTNAIGFNINKVLTCPYCFGIWSALIIAGLVYIDKPWSTAIVIILGIAGGQAFLESLSSKV